MSDEAGIVILTGAGISAESGIRTFRAADGLWENHRIEDVASPEGFRRDPAVVYKFYNERRRQLRDPQIKPNAAHLALAELEAKWPGPFLLVTQNVDNLHARAGSKKMVQMHGELLKARCTYCHKAFAWEDDLDDSHDCPDCGFLGRMRPHIVWFGEMPLFMGTIGTALETASVFVSIGTSGQVYPAAGLVQSVPRSCRKIEVNVAGTEISSAFDEHRVGPASQKVTELVRELLQ